MAAAYFDIEVQRNGDYLRQFSIVADDGTAIDLTGATHAFDVKYRAGDPDPPIASATITPVNLVGGGVDVLIDGADFAAVPGVNEIVRLAYDWVVTQDGVSTPLARGALLLVPGVS